MPTRDRSKTGSTSGELMFSPSMKISPVTLAPSIVSFIRFRHRRKVDLPQPDGPISAVTDRSYTGSDTSNTACLPL